MVTIYMIVYDPLSVMYHVYDMQLFYQGAKLFSEAKIQVLEIWLGAWQGPRSNN